jgi:uncharacterized membrane protein
MLGLAILLSVLFACLAIQAPFIEVFLAIAFVAPVFWLILIKLTLSLPIATFFSLTFCVLSAGYICGIRKNKKEVVENLKNEFPHICLFLSVFLFTLYLNALVWPDFFPLGERLRDLSILASVIDNPISIEEPWLSGHPLNYYVYWYRFGSFLASLLNLDHWASYHFIVALAISLYFLLIARLSAYLGFSKFISIVVALFISFGSNIEGVRFFLQSGDNWWSPSRVIKGTINEYPAWSFILGDAHPHFLNLPLFPLFCLIVLKLKNSLYSKALKINPLLVCFSCLSIFFTLLLNSNPWDIPLWSAFVCLLGVTYFVSNSIEISSLKKHLAKYNITDLVIFFLTILLIFSFLYFKQPVVASDSPWNLVKTPVQQSLTSEFLLHWGVGIVLLLISLPCILLSLAPRGFNLKLQFLVYGTCLFFSLIALSSEFSVLLIFLCLALCTIVLVFDLQNKDSNFKNSSNRNLVNCLGFASLTFMMFVELIYLDDAYGGENERMNTVFKVYSFIWFPFHLYAFFQFKRCLTSAHGVLIDKLSVNPFGVLFAKYSFLAVVVIVFCGSSTRMIFSKIPGVARQDAVSTSELSKVEKSFGTDVVNAINFLKKQAHDFGSVNFSRKPVVLEAQGDAYSWTTFISSIAGQQSYLGWANHINFLTRKHEEVTRREEVTNYIYSTANCESIKEKLRTEAIDFVIVGSLELARYSIQNLDRFSCLNASFSSPKISIFSAH